MHAFLDEVSYNKKGNQVTLRMNAWQEKTSKDAGENTEADSANPVVVLA